MKSKSFMCAVILLSLAGCHENCEYAPSMKAWGESLCAQNGGLDRFRGGGKFSHKAQCNDGSTIKLSSNEFHSRESYVCRKPE